MNIFFTNEDPLLCAKDSYQAPELLKMVLESAQLLSNQMRIDFCIPNVKVKLYNVFNINHPSRLWLSSSSGNVFWLIDYALELARLHEKDTGVYHASASVIEGIEREYRYYFSRDNNITLPYLCTATDDLKTKYGRKIYVPRAEMRLGNYVQSDICSIVYIANSIEDACTAYQLNFINNKDYWKEGYTFETRYQEKMDCCSI